MLLRYLPVIVGLLASVTCDARTDLIEADAQMAVEHARLGLGIVSVVKSATESVRLDAATLPFLGAQLEGREALRIDVAEPRWPSLELPYVRALSVLMTPDGNAVLRVTSPWPENEPPIAPFPSAAVEQRQLAAHEERFTRLPSGQGSVTLAAALAIVAQNGGDLAHTRQILAYYLVRDTGRGERTVWVIQLRGIPPFAAAKPGVPDDARNHLRHVVDAETGEWLGADSLPQPEGR